LYSLCRNMKYNPCCCLCISEIKDRCQ